MTLSIIDELHNDTRLCMLSFDNAGSQVFIVILGVIVQNVVFLSVVMLGVVAPMRCLCQDKKIPIMKVQGKLWNFT